MKSITIIRHAESSYIASVLTDFDRPLNQKGVEDAQLMGQILSDKKINIQLIISSSANRTLNTAQIISKKINYKQKIEQKKSLYSASWKEVVDIITKVSNNIDSIAIIGHNPTVHLLSEKLSYQNFDNFPTCAIAKINLNIQSWDKLNQSLLSDYDNIGELKYFIFPKKLAL